MTEGEDLSSWALELYATYGPAIAELIGAADVPAIRVLLQREGPGAAWTNGTDVYLSTTWFAARPDDVGGLVHEFTHAIMRAPVYDDSTRWLIEGIADWVRDRLGHDAPWTRAHHEPDKALAGYQTTAHFLAWLEARWPGTVRELSRRLIAGTYADEAFLEFTGRDLGARVSEYEREQQAGR